MNKNIKNIVVGLILLVGMVAMVVYILRSRADSAPTECPPPTLPNGVPADAYWAGGCAGGSWIYMVENSNNEYHFQVFTDRKGKLRIDAQFIPDSAVTVDINRTNWKDYKLYYTEGMDSLVYIVVASPTDTMKLHSTYPAFGGEVWDEIKKAQELQGVYDNVSEPVESSEVITDGMKEIHRKDWSYILYKKEDEFFLNILCGKVGQYEVVVKLTSEQEGQYKKDGINYIEKLAEEVRRKS